jgi:hypothetical protein
MPATPEQLTQAETAYHQLMTGKSPNVVVDQNGERVEFTAANPVKLAQYIQMLRNELSSQTRGPLRPFF